MRSAKTHAEFGRANMRTNSRIVGLLSLLFAGCAVIHAEKSSALDQTYPAKPVHIVEPFGLGGGARARQLRRSTATAWTASAQVALLSLPASSCGCDLLVSRGRARNRIAA